MPLILGTLASAVTANFAPPAFESIATFSITSNTPSVTFSSIPSTYKHLQIRGVGTNTANGGGILLRMNGDTAANYVQHTMYGTGAAAGASANLSQTSINCGGVSYGISATNPRAFIVDILDYASGNKFKTSRAITGEDENGAGEVTFQSGLWRNTTAVTSLTVVMQNDFTSGSHIALYGVL